MSDAIMPTSVDLRLVSLSRQGARSSSDAEAAMKSFEAHLVGEMLKQATRPMFEEEDGLFDGGSSGRMYQEQLFAELGRAVAREAGLGLTEQLAPELAKVAERNEKELGGENRER